MRLSKPGSTGMVVETKSSSDHPASEVDAAVGDGLVEQQVVAAPEQGGEVDVVNGEVVVNDGEVGVVDGELDQQEPREELSGDRSQGGSQLDSEETLVLGPEAVVDGKVEQQEPPEGLSGDRSKSKDEVEVLGQQSLGATEQPSGEAAEGPNEEGMQQSSSGMGADVVDQAGGEDLSAAFGLVDSLWAARSGTPMARQPRRSLKRSHTLNSQADSMLDDLSDMELDNKPQPPPHVVVDLEEVDGPLHQDRRGP